MNINIIKRKVKNIRIEVKGENVKIVIPAWITDEKTVLKKTMSWIEKAVKRQIELHQRAESLKLYDHTPENFKAYVKRKVNEFSKELNVKIFEIKFRKMKRKWGSCSSKGKITINTLCRYLPYNLIDYIVFHEVLHRKFMNHGKDFKNAIKNKFIKWKELEENLKLYSIKIQANTKNT